MSKKVVVGIVIGAGVLLAAYFNLANPFADDSDRVAALKKAGRKVKVLCVNPQCGFTEDDYSVKATDQQWPKECPECEQMTLHKTMVCPHCGKETGWATPSDEKPSVRCTQCGKEIWLLSTPPPRPLR